MQDIVNEIVVYQPDETLRLEVRLESETVWLTQEQMCELFQRERTVITKHVRNIFSEGECEEYNNVQILHINPRGRPLTLYSLDVIISVGYRVKSMRGILFRRWATQVLKSHLLRGYSINARINQFEDKVDKRLAGQDKEIGELKEKVAFFVRTSLPPVQGVFYDGQVFDARIFASRHILSAKKSILLVDNWVNVITLEILAKKAVGVTVEIVISRNGNRLARSDIDTFNTQYGDLTVRESANFHDRFLIIDNKELYLIGASLKDLGRKCFAFTKLDESEIVGLKARI